MSPFEVFVTLEIRIFSEIFLYRRHIFQLPTIIIRPEPVFHRLRILPKRGMKESEPGIPLDIT